MSQPFKHTADNLLNFFSQPGRGFYIPYYQRNYSWDEENAEKLITDIFNGTKRVISKPSNSIFLGTVILHDEKDLVVGIHTDKPNLLTKVSNVVDGQQRITSLGLLASTLINTINNEIKNIDLYTSSGSEFKELIQELDNQKPQLQEFFSVEIKKNGAEPNLKPLIIRADNIDSNPVSDQWTLSGDGNVFYRSNTASFISEFINKVEFESIKKELRVGSVIEKFLQQIENELDATDELMTEDLLHANTDSNSSLYRFMDYPPDLENVTILPSNEKIAFYRGVFLLAVCSFFKNSCHLVVIECQDESIAFDMFQSLNATGTPLTAFEVFKPQIVKEYGRDYTNLIKSEVDRIESIFENEKTASGKEDLTDKVIGISALVYSGSLISTKFSEERDWLMSNFPSPPSNLTKIFISCIADQAEYRENFIRVKKSRNQSVSSKIISYLQSIGLSSEQADISALCIVYLRDAKHQFAHSVISIFYAKLLRAQENKNNICNAAKDFMSVCKATAAFFTLWMGALQSKFPDAVYKSLFQSINNITVKNGITNQTDVYIKRAFREALEKQNIYNQNDISEARNLWVDKAKENSWYLKKSVCRFALLVSSHDAALNLTPGEEGLLIDGKPRSATMLTSSSWDSRDYEVIEHVATRDKPSVIVHSKYFDPEIYPGNKSVVDKIGNLTLLSRAVNSSLYSEWPDKIFYYWSLTTPSQTANSPTSTDLMSKLGIKKLPPSLLGLCGASNYLSHLAPLAYRGTLGLKWDLEFINKRSRNLSERIFDKLSVWLEE